MKSPFINKKMSTTYQEKAKTPVNPGSSMTGEPTKNRQGLHTSQGAIRGQGLVSVKPQTPFLCGKIEHENKPIFLNIEMPR